MRIAIYLGIAVNAMFYAASAIYHSNGLRPRRVWHCFGSILVHFAHPGGYATADANPEAGWYSRRLCYRPTVSACWPEPGFLSTTDDYSAIIASILGMYYRVQASNSDDISWNEVPALTLA